MKNPTNQVPLRLISLKNGSAFNNLRHLPFSVPCCEYVMQDYAGISVIDINSYKILYIHKLKTGDYSIFVDKTQDEVIIHTTQYSKIKTKVKKIVKEKQIIKRGFFKKDKEVEVEKEVEEDGKDTIERDYQLIKINLN